MRTITIEGMSCNHCAMAVMKALSGIEGVTNVKVDVAEGKASFDEAKPVTLEQIKATIEKAGYRVNA
jgi:copper chaperone